MENYGKKLPKQTLSKARRLLESWLRMSCNSKDELAEIQKLFSAAVFRQPGCKTLDSAFEDIAMNLIKPCATQSSSERLGVYREQYWYRAYDSLADDFRLS